MDVYLLIGRLYSRWDFGSNGKLLFQSVVDEDGIESEMTYDYPLGVYSTPEDARSSAIKWLKTIHINPSDEQDPLHDPVKSFHILVIRMNSKPGSASLVDELDPFELVQMEDSGKNFDTKYF